MSDERMGEIWLVNRIKEAHLDLIRAEVLDRVATELSGNMRVGSVYDTAHRM